LRTKVGQGLRYQYRKERDMAQADLQALLSKPASYRYTSEDLNKLSVPGMGVTINDLTLQNLRRAPTDEQQILANKLVGEVSLARTMEKALIARDLMNAGAQEPNISASGEVAQTEIDYSRQRLQAEIDNVLFESEVRQKIITNAAGTIAQRGSARNQDNQRFTDFVRIRPARPGMTEGGINE